MTNFKIEWSTFPYKKELTSVLKIYLKTGLFPWVAYCNDVQIIILFDQEFHKSCDGVAVGSSLGPTVSDVFLCYHEKVWLKICFSKFKPVIYIKVRWSYIFVFYFLLETTHWSTCETKSENSILFLYIKVSRDNDKFTTSVYCKLTFSGAFPHLESFITKSYKHNFLHTSDILLQEIDMQKIFLEITVMIVFLICVLKSTQIKFL